MLKKLGGLFASGTRELPLFPLSSIVFPGGHMPLKVFEQRYLDLIKTCLAKESTFGICGIREGSEVGEPAVPYEVGTEVRIVEWDMPQTGIFHIVVEGVGRYVARNWQANSQGLLMAQIETVSNEAECPVPDELRLCVQVLKHAMGKAAQTETHYANAVWVGYRLAEILPFGLKVKQDLLEMNDSIMRLRIIDQFLRKTVR